MTQDKKEVDFEVEKIESEEEKVTRSEQGWMHTDLAVELRESFSGDGGEIPGVAVEEMTLSEAELKLTRVEILDERGAQIMGKPIGTYLTLEGDFGNYEEACIEELARAIGELLPEEAVHILTVGLGNAELTADSLGPIAISHVWINGHLAEVGGLCGLAPGVMSQTGMETATIIKGVVEEEHPQAVIVIDALAARDVSRLGRTIQLTDTGIHPGSGVGNHRAGIDKDTMGAPVIAIGVPTVISASVIAENTFRAVQEGLSAQTELAEAAHMLSSISPEQKYKLLQEKLDVHLRSLLVTPKDIDETVIRLGKFVAAGINLAVNDRITWEEGHISDKSRI